METPETQHFTMALKCSACGRTGRISISQVQKTKMTVGMPPTLDSVPDGFMRMPGDNWEFQCTKCRAPA
jgi:hypothetical protein